MCSYGNYNMPKNISILSKFHLLDKEKIDFYIDKINNSSDEEFNELYLEIINL